MCEMAAMCKIQAHECVSRFQTCHQDRHVGLSAGMGLYICIFSLEYLAYSVNGELLDLIDAETLRLAQLHDLT